VVINNPTTHHHHRWLIKKKETDKVFLDYSRNLVNAHISSLATPTKNHNSKKIKTPGRELMFSDGQYEGRTRDLGVISTSFTSKGKKA
jgi:hypothetical protein